MARYLVTGGTGFIGRHLVTMLTAQGHQVVIAARGATGGPREQPGVVFARADVTERESLREPMRGVDGVFHMAAWYQLGARDAAPAYRINVEGTRNVLTMAQELEVPKIVYTSTLAAHGDTKGEVVDESHRYAGGRFTSEYERTKWMAHIEVAVPMMEQGLPLVIASPGVVYGEDDPSPTGGLFRDYLRRKLPLLPAPYATRYCWEHVEDAARGHLLCMEKGAIGQEYHVAGPVHSVAEVFALAERVTGVKGPSLRPGPGFMKALTALHEIVNMVIPLQGSFHPESLRSVAGTTFTATSEKARRALGFSPRSLEDGLPPTLRHEMRKLGLTPPG